MKRLKRLKRYVAVMQPRDDGCYLLHEVFDFSESQSRFRTSNAFICEPYGKLRPSKLMFARVANVIVVFLKTSVTIYVKVVPSVFSN